MLKKPQSPHCVRQHYLKPGKAWLRKTEPVHFYLGSLRVVQLPRTKQVLQVSSAPAASRQSCRNKMFTLELPFLQTPTRFSNISSLFCTQVAASLLDVHHHLTYCAAVATPAGLHKTPHGQPNDRGQALLRNLTGGRNRKHQMHW